MPIDTPQKSRFDEKRVVRIHLLTPRNEIQRAMGEAIYEITAAMQAQGVPPTGPWFAHHHRRPTDTFDFDVCFPVGSALETTGRLENVVLPAVDVMRTVYHGHYEGLITAWPEFMRQLDASGLKIRPDVFEVYLVGPSQTSDPKAWQTGLNCPLAESAA